MNKSNLISIISEKVNQPKHEIQAILNLVLDEIAGSIANGEDVILKGFGKFTAVGLKPRAGRNPRTGQQIHIPAKIRPSFKAGIELFKTLNSKDLY